MLFFPKKVFKDIEHLRFRIDFVNYYFFFAIDIHMEGYKNQLVAAGNRFYGGLINNPDEDYNPTQLEARNLAIEEIKNFLFGIKLPNEKIEDILNKLKDSKHRDIQIS